MYRERQCENCSLVAPVRGWLLTPLGYYCADCALKLPPNAQALGAWYGNARQTLNEAKRIRAAKEKRETDKRKRRAFAEAVGKHLPPEYTPGLPVTWYLHEDSHPSPEALTLRLLIFVTLGLSLAVMVLVIIIWKAGLL